MKRFTDFLNESKESHVVLSFGRFNPPSRGHQHLIEKVHEIAEQYGADHHVVLSHVQDHNKNPLDPETKLKYAQDFFPNTNLELSDKKYPGIIQQAEKLNSGHTNLHVIAGKDRILEYETLLNRYNGKNYHYDNITVHSAGNRNPLSKGIEGVSGTKLREFAKQSDVDSFIRNLPTNGKHKLELYHDVRKGLGILEESTGKALFLVGGPGSGKDIILRPLLQYCKEISPNQLPNLSTTKLLEQKQNLIINGAWDNVADISQAKMYLETYEYDTMMVFVYVSDEISRKRNEERKNSGRLIKESTRHDKWLIQKHMIPFYQSLFQDNFCLYENYNNDNDQLYQLLEDLSNIFTDSVCIKDSVNINTKINQLFLNELFGQGYPIFPDDQNPVNKETNPEWTKINAKKKKKPNPTGANFKTSVDRNNSIPGHGPGREFDIRGSEAIGPGMGIGDPTFRESEDFTQPNFGGMGSTNSEPMVTPGEKIIQNLPNSINIKPKKRFKDLKRKSG